MKRTQKVHLTAGVILLAAACHAQWFNQGAVLVFTEENDGVVGEDKHYTQGLKISYLHADDSAPDWLTLYAYSMPAWGYQPQAIKIGTQIGQNIYTPKNTETSRPVEDDRPYAGWLYTGFILQRRGLTAGGRPTLESIQADVGIVGPPALGKEAQHWAHKDDLDGWHNQLETEPGLALKYLRAWVISPDCHGPRTFDFIPHAGFSFGNIDTSLRVGATVRAGINLPDDFGSQTINSLATTEGGSSRNGANNRWGFHLFCGAEGRIVAYNEFLNGNVFHDSVSVTPEPLVGWVKGGGALQYQRFEAGAALVWSTDEFTGQGHTDTFGTVYLKVKL